MDYYLPTYEDIEEMVKDWSPNYVSARRAIQHLNRSRDNMASFYVHDCYDYIEDDDEMEYER